MNSEKTPSVSEAVKTLADVKKRIIDEIDVFLTPFSTYRGMYMGCSSCPMFFKWDLGEPKRIETTFDLSGCSKITYGVYACSHHESISRAHLEQLKKNPHAYTKQVATEEEQCRPILVKMQKDIEKAQENFSQAVSVATQHPTTVIPTKETDNICDFCGSKSDNINHRFIAGSKVPDGFRIRCCRNHEDHAEKALKHHAAHCHIYLLSQLSLFTQ